MSKDEGLHKGPTGSSSQGTSDSFTNDPAVHRGLRQLAGPEQSLSRPIKTLTMLEYKRELARLNMEQPRDAVQQLVRLTNAVYAAHLDGFEYTIKRLFKEAASKIV